MCMKKMTVLITAIFLILPLNVPAETFVFGALEHLPPYHYKENGQWKGIDIEIGKELSERLGFEIKYEGLPWARMKKYAEKGKIDGIISMFCLEKYFEIVDFAESPVIADISVFARAGSDIKVSGLDDLKGKSVGIIRGYTYSPEFVSRRDMKKMECDNDEMLVKILEKGRVDVAVAENIPFRFISKKFGFQNRFKKLYTVSGNKVCMAFSKKALGRESKVWAGKVSGIFRKLKEEGVIQKILDNYLR